MSRANGRNSRSKEFLIDLNWRSDGIVCHKATVEKRITRLRGQEAKRSSAVLCPNHASEAAIWKIILLVSFWSSIEVTIVCEDVGEGVKNGEKCKIQAVIKCLHVKWCKTRHRFERYACLRLSRIIYCLLGGFGFVHETAEFVFSPPKTSAFCRCKGVRESRANLVKTEIENDVLQQPPDPALSSHHGLNQDSELEPLFWQSKVLSIELCETS
ncbi:hypothetical protein RRG08_026275 [Elysia crispata]|uniref:Uncharacterized protein n=1 Tax=Elysia crispata TaxID=231223 RepID=A0AAE0ZAV3_9GAST|nr:hypothetical protein RRG08_026275 [Elysia crispata]